MDRLFMAFLWMTYVNLFRTENTVLLNFSLSYAVVVP